MENDVKEKATVLGEAAANNITSNTCIITDDDNIVNTKIPLATIETMTNQANVGEIVYNEHYLQKPPKELIFIVQESVEALCVEQAGGAAIALQGKEPTFFIEAVREYRPVFVDLMTKESRKVTFISLLNIGGARQKTALFIKNQLQRLGYFLHIPPKNHAYKDVKTFIEHNETNFKFYLENCIIGAEIAASNQREDEELERREVINKDLGEIGTLQNLVYPDEVEKKANGATIWTPSKKSYKNLAYLLERCSVSVRYNRVTLEVEAWNGKGELLKDDLDSLATKFLRIADLNGLSLNYNTICNFINTLASEATYNPVQEYLKAAGGKYDGTDHLEDLFRRFTFLKGQDVEFAKTLILKWLISCVALAFNDDAKESSDSMLVLQGAGGIGKSRFLSRLVPDQSWIVDGLRLDPRDRDSVRRATSCWICEICELNDSLRRDTFASLKAFLTCREDIYREPFGHFPIKRPRTTAFLATVNDEKFLKDLTGNRKYSVVAVDHIDNEEPINCEGLWGQLYNMWRNGETHRLTDEERNRLNESNIAFEVTSAEEEALLDLLDFESNESQQITATELNDRLGFKRENVNKLGKALHHLMKVYPDKIKKPYKKRTKGDRQWTLPVFQKDE